MYCINCGREWKDGELYCGSCGAIRSNQTNPSQGNVVVRNTIQTKKGLPTWAIILMVIGGVILAGIIGFALLFVVFLAIDISSYDYYETIYEQTESYVNLSGDEIPTIYEIRGEYELCESPGYSYNDSREDTDYYYCDDYMDSYILDEYADTLIDDYDFKEYEKKDDRRVLVKDSFEEGYVIQVTVFYYRESVEYSRIVVENYGDLDNSL